MDQCKITASPDISGLGVRISLYLQTGITIIFIAISPENAKPAWWSMTTTAMGLSIACVVAGTLHTITLLDAIILSHLLILPLITATYAQSRLIEYQRVTSPLLVLVDTIRLVLTSAFGIWLWALAPNFGKNPECNGMIYFAFFGCKIRATSVGARVIGLIFWASSGFIFLFRQVSTLDTLVLSVKALFSDFAARAFRLPRRTGPGDKTHRVDLRLDISITFGLQIPFFLELPIYTWRPRPVEIHGTKKPTKSFHAPVSIIPRKILDSQLGATIRWILLVITVACSGFVMIMIELTLSVENPSLESDRSIGFGQILPLVLIVAPALAVIDWWLQYRANTILRRQSILLNLHRARNLPDSPSGTKPSCFCVISVSDTEEIYTTWIQQATNEPEWKESFVLEVTELSGVLVQVFDADKNGMHRLIGQAIFTSLHNPFQDVYTPEGNNVNKSAPLRCNGVLGNSVLEYSISTDTDHPTDATPDTLTPRGPVRRMTQCFTFYSSPVITLFSLTYRLETVSQTFNLTNTTTSPTRLGRGDGQAYAVWVAVASIIPSISYGISFEKSPTRLPAPSRDPPQYTWVAFKWGAGLNRGGIRRQWVPGPSNHLEVNIRLWTRELRLLVPFVSFTRSEEGFALSMTVFGLTSFGLAKTRPLEP